MSSLPLKLGLQTSEEYESTEEIVAEVADLSLTEKAAPSSSNLLHHFSHDHPLIEGEEGTDAENTYGVRERNFCSVCSDDPVLDDGPIYRCSTRGCKFFLHKSCAELPMNMVSTIHPEHLLQLFPSSLSFTCDMCDNGIFGFIYHCPDPQCNFDLHITCASLNKYEPQTHDDQDHSFILLKPATFTCDACGIDEERKMVSFLCTTCQTQVHTYKRCSSSSFPLTLKQILHSHELILSYSFQSDFDFSHKSCKICNKQMNNVFCFYYCSTCAYVAHVSCATSEKLRDEYENENVAECDLATEFIQHDSPAETNKISRLSGDGDGDGDDKKATELQQQQLLKNFSHPHYLILSNDEPESDKICDGCLRPISGPFYTCPDQCNFSLHKQCGELRGKIRHPLHKHPLTLHATHPSTCFGLFNCRGCDVEYNGFTYRCEVCNAFSICVRCSLFSDTLSHERHQCTLNLMDSDETKCNACGLNCFTKFVCHRCNFNLCLRCASLPKETMHKCPKPDWGIRPIKLTYSSVEDVSGEYYCDYCEELRGQNHWFYYCEPCNYSLHPQCILGKDLIQFGRTHKFKYHHHPFTLVKTTKGRLLCAPCAADTCKDKPLMVCAECDICIHFWGTAYVNSMLKDLPSSLLNPQ